jgi:spermidine/putrescine transport system permease protein
MKRIFPALSLLILYIFLYLPLILIVIFSFNDSRYSPHWQGFTLQWYQKLFDNEALILAALRTFTIALSSATFATMIGALSAYFLYRHKFKAKNTILSLMFVVMVSPDIAMAISLLAFF